MTKDTLLESRAANRRAAANQRRSDADRHKQRGDLDRAIDLLYERLSHFVAETLTPHHEDNPALIETLKVLGDWCAEAGRTREADSMRRKAQLLLERRNSGVPAPIRAVVRKSRDVVGYIARRWAIKGRRILLWARQHLWCLGKVSVFLSSTFLDLMDERERLTVLLRQAGFNVIRMEERGFQGAQGNRALVWSEQQARKCDLFLMLFGFSVGSQPRDLHLDEIFGEGEQVPPGRSSRRLFDSYVGKRALRRRSLVENR